MRTFYIVAICCIIALSSCGNGNTTASKTTSDSAKVQAAQPVSSKLSEVGTNKLMTVLTTYYSLKNALVATKSADAGHAATKLVADADSLQSW